MSSAPNRCLVVSAGGLAPEDKLINSKVASLKGFFQICTANKQPKSGKMVKDGRRLNLKAIKNPYFRLNIQ